MNEESGTEGGDGEGSGVGFILEPALNQRTTLSLPGQCTGAGWCQLPAQGHLGQLPKRGPGVGQGGHGDCRSHALLAPGTGEKGHHPSQLGKGQALEAASLCPLSL